MFDNVALNVVIGLVFIYLLYSLLASVLSEIFATYIGLRARNLKEAVDRMLNDDKSGAENFFARLWDSLKLMKNPKNPRIINFYNHPEIKYLGSTGIFKNPSQFKAVSFSKTILNLLNETALRKQMDNTVKMQNPKEGDIKHIPVTEITKDNIAFALDEIIKAYDNTNDSAKDWIVLDHETAKYVMSLWKECYGDLVKFKLQLEAWFDRTMEQCTEWYKRKIQIILLVLGFSLAWFFNADTFSIIHKLSTDKAARENMVNLATAYTQSHTQLPPLSIITTDSAKREVDTSKINADTSKVNVDSANARLDSLLDIKNVLEQDISNANTILGSGGWLPDEVIVYVNPKNQQKIYTPFIDGNALPDTFKNINKGKITFTATDKRKYFFRLVAHHFFGFLITAIAISLGAPFWFDLLNKLMQLRTSIKQDTSSTNTTASGTVSPVNREA